METWCTQQCDRGLIPGWWLSQESHLIWGASESENPIRGPHCFLLNKALLEFERVGAEWGGEADEELPWVSFRQGWRPHGWRIPSQPMKELASEWWWCWVFPTCTFNLRLRSRGSWPEIKSILLAVDYRFSRLWPLPTALLFSLLLSLSMCHLTLLVLGSCQTHPSSGAWHLPWHLPGAPDPGIVVGLIPSLLSHSSGKSLL